MNTVEVEIIVDTFVVAKDGHTRVKAGSKVQLPEAEAAHLVAGGVAKPAAPVKP